MAVRPARLGLLVPTRVDEIAWLKLFEAALAAQARVWGASGNLIFPLTADVAERELFWELADRFDADAFVTYAPEWTEMRELAPEAYSARRGRLSRQASELDLEANAINDFVEDADSHVAFNVMPTVEQKELLDRRLAPFRERGDSEWLHSFNATSGLAWPFTDAASFDELPGSIVNPIAPGGAARTLLLTAIAGRVPLALHGSLSERGVSVVNEPLRRRYRWASIVVDRRRGGQPTYPWAIADQGLATYHAAPWRAGHAAVVVADTAWDFLCSTRSSA